jgi:hypothetical protein
VAWICSGLASDSKKQGKLSGFGSALIKVTVSSIVCGESDTPAGARQPGVGLREPGALAFDAGSLQPSAHRDNHQAQNETRASKRYTART